MISKYSIAVIFPIYNEEDNIRSSLDLIVSYLSQSFERWEVIAIESGSTDQSSQIIDDCAKGDARIRVFHQDKREGYGSALKLGILKARMELIWTITPDIPFDMAHIHKALPLLEDHACVLSYRSKDQRHVGRKILSMGYNVLSRRALGLSNKHINSAFKVFKAGLLKKIPLKSNGWFIDAEILVELKNRKIEYAEIPVDLIDRTKGKSTVTFSSVMTILKEMVSFKTNAK